MKAIPKTGWILAAIVTCPKCGLQSSVQVHTIAADGAVSPALRCPNQMCNFEESVILEGWKQ